MQNVGINSSLFCCLQNTSLVIELVLHSYHPSLSNHSIVTLSLFCSIALIRNGAESVGNEENVENGVRRKRVWNKAWSCRYPGSETRTPIYVRVESDNNLICYLGEEKPVLFSSSPVAALIALFYEQC